jgi:signal transduction histidine kinase
VETDVERAPAVSRRDRRTLAFRLARELLFNVVKHAGASHAQLAAHPQPGKEEDADDWLRLVVRDEGDGFDPSRPEGEGYGLAGMRERLRYLGGTLEVESAPGEGTRATATIPLRGRPEEKKA